MRMIVIIQARLGSTRLPGKVLMDLAGEPMLARVVKRVKQAKTIDEIVVATTDQAGDEPVERLCRQRGLPCYRGSEHDVLDRFYRAAVAHRAEAVVRITSDCPLIDPGIIDWGVNEFSTAQPEVEYVSNSYPRDTFPRGLDIEVIRFDALERAWKEDANPAWREHVTVYIYRHEEMFHLRGVTNDVDLSHLRWTVDTPEDFQFALRVYEHFGHDRFTWREILAAVERHPEWMEVNRFIRQKEIAAETSGRSSCDVQLSPAKR
jgi:spore coat polysaccharide biosynthesis protein SpsF